MIARVPVGRLWVAGVIPGLVLSGLFILYIVIRCKIQPEMGPALPREEWDIPVKDKLKAFRAGLFPLFIIFMMSGLFFMGITSLVESSAVGAVATTIAAAVKKD